MNIRELREHFISRAPWVNGEQADKLRLGDAEAEVRRIGTGWTACADNLQAAADDGCDLFISHEYPFAGDWGHEAGRESPWGRRRAEICQRAGMALMNLHDTWDHWPVCGIRDSWAKHLGLGEPVQVLDYLHPGQTTMTAGWKSLGIYAVPETTVEGYARHVAERVRPLRMDGVSVMGDLSAPVRTVAIGVGCHIPSFECHEAGVDLLIMVYDRALQTTVRIPLIELGAKLIVLEHGSAEMPAMRDMAEYINETFPDLKATFYCREPITRTIGAEG